VEVKRELREVRQVEKIGRSLTSVDWDDLEEVQQASECLLRELATQPALLRDSLASLPDRPDLLALCEHYDILDKIVLFNDRGTGVRVRLHVFLPGYFDRPHNHRWSYTSLILRGSYRHYLFGEDHDLDEQLAPAELRARMVRQETTSNAYTLHHSMVHSVVAEPYTVSLIVRGPSVKDRFLVMDRVENRSWWQYGAAIESATEAAQKQMSPERLALTQSRIASLGILQG
jgi:hypothetical protein